MLDVKTKKVKKLDVGTPQTVSLSADGTRAVVTFRMRNRAAEVKLLELPSGKVLRTQRRVSWLRSVALSADGKRVAENASNGQVHVWEAETGRAIATFKLGRRWLWAALLSADGKLYTCLFATKGHDLRSLLRAGSTDEEIAEFLRSVWKARDDRYSDLRSSRTPDLPKVEMSYVGG